MQQLYRAGFIATQGLTILQSCVSRPTWEASLPQPHFAFAGSLRWHRIAAMATRASKLQRGLVGPPPVCYLSFYYLWAFTL